MYNICHIKNISGNAYNLMDKEFANNEVYQIPDSMRAEYAGSDAVLACLVAETFCILDSDENEFATISAGVDYLKQLGRTPVIQYPFADKSTHIYRGTGKQFLQVAENATTELIFEVPSGTFDFDGLDVIVDSSEYGDTAELYVRDRHENPIYGTPDAIISQFGYDWNVKPYSCSKAMKYNATLVQGLQICVNYTNNSDSAKDIYINYDLHKLRT